MRTRLLPPPRTADAPAAAHGRRPRLPAFIPAAAPAAAAAPGPPAAPAAAPGAPDGPAQHQQGPRGQGAAAVDPPPLIRPRFRVTSLRHPARSRSNLVTNRADFPSFDPCSSPSQVVDDLASMGFTKDEIRAVMRKLTESGQASGPAMRMSCPAPETHRGIPCAVHGPSACQRGPSRLSRRGWLSSVTLHSHLEQAAEATRTPRCLRQLPPSAAARGPECRDRQADERRRGRGERRAARRVVQRPAVKLVTRSPFGGRAGGAHIQGCWGFASARAP